MDFFSSSSSIIFVYKSIFCFSLFLLINKYFFAPMDSLLLFFIWDRITGQNQSEWSFCFMCLRQIGGGKVNKYQGISRPPEVYIAWWFLLIVQSFISELVRVCDHSIVMPCALFTMARTNRTGSVAIESIHPRNCLIAIKLHVLVEYVYKTLRAYKH